MLPIVQAIERLSNAPGESGVDLIFDKNCRTFGSRVASSHSPVRLCTPVLNTVLGRSEYRSVANEGINDRYMCSDT